MPRLKPYTETGIKKLKCFRCKKPAYSQWTICADDNVYRPICKKCDLMLNELCLRWMGFKNWDSKIYKYKLKLEKEK